MSRVPNLKAIRMRIKQVEIELERLRMLERLAVMQRDGVPKRDAVAPA